MSLHWPIIRRLAAHPLRQCVTDDRRSYRGVDLLVGALHVAAELERRCQTDTVGLLLPTSGLFPMAALAGWMLGKVVVPLNYLLKEEELRYVIDDCETDTILTVGPMLDHIGWRPQVPSVVRFEDLSFSGLPDLRWPATAADDDLAVILYTSGTSGTPKGVMLTHGNIGANMRQFSAWIDFDKDEVFLGVLPQFHVFGLTVLTITPLVLGFHAHYMARFVPQQIVKAMRRQRPTIFVAIPSMYNALLSVKGAKAEDFASLRYAISGGEPLPKAVFERFKDRFGIEIREGYGLTETAPVTNWRRPNDPTPFGSVGRAIPDVHERIVCMETGRDLPADQEGEIRITGPNVMRGYYKLPAESAEAFDERGYFRTGDIGKLDVRGNLYITGRLKEMLIVGGENVFPREIEEVLNQHPSVGASAVIGKADEVRGELPLAFVELRDGASFDEQALKGWCRDRLAGYKVPRWIRAIDALPRNPTGKILRRELKATAE
ncbi:MAG: class I adenylate-forming enzyme family protein [Phycisphaerales bacterium JB039]